MVEPFIRIYTDKQKEEFDNANMDAWLSGLYFTYAIAANFNNKEHKYPEKPIDFRAAEEKYTMEEHVANFREFAMAFNIQINKKNRTSVERQESDGDTDGDRQT